MLNRNFLAILISFIGTVVSNPETVEEYQILTNELMDALKDVPKSSMADAAEMMRSEDAATNAIVFDDAAPNPSKGIHVPANFLVVHLVTDIEAMTATQEVLNNMLVFFGWISLEEAHSTIPAVTKNSTGIPTVATIHRELVLLKGKLKIIVDVMDEKKLLNATAYNWLNDLKTGTDMDITVDDLNEDINRLRILQESIIETGIALFIARESQKAAQPKASDNEIPNALLESIFKDFDAN